MSIFTGKKNQSTFTEKMLPCLPSRVSKPPRPKSGTRLCDGLMGSLKFLITTICTVLPIVVLYAPFFPHILDAWSKRNHPNMHFMFFEDMKKVIRFNVILIAYMTGLNFWLRI